MRILEVVHYFLPRHSAGTEVYTAEVARRLRRLGHEVCILHTEKILSEREGVLLRRDFEGIPTRVLVNNLTYREFRDTFRHRMAEEAFERVLDDFRPDLVHVQHLMLHSFGLPHLAERRGIPVVMSLHDFWLACARFGQLLERGERLCEGPEAERCARCLDDFKYAQSPVERTLIGWIRWTKEVAGFDLAPLVESWRRSRLRTTGLLRPRGRARRRVVAGGPSPALVEGIAERFEELRRLADSVRLFLAPSETVRERMVRYGLPPGKTERLPLGIDPVAAGPRPGLAGRAPVFGFLGTIAPHKGLHVLVEAMRRMRPPPPLEVFGSGAAHPDYAASVRQAAKGLPVRFHGPVPRHRIAEALGAVDVVVVPSVWFENSPIVILEARSAGRPVVASRQGGMAELVEDGVDGLLFEPGDPVALAEALEGLAAKPERIEELARRVRPPPTLDEHVARLEERFARVVAPAGGG